MVYNRTAEEVAVVVVVGVAEQAEAAQNLPPMIFRQLGMLLLPLLLDIPIGMAVAVAAVEVLMLKYWRLLRRRQRLRSLLVPTIVCDWDWTRRHDNVDRRISVRTVRVVAA